MENSDISDYLKFSQEDKNLALFYAAAHGTIDNINNLLNAGADPSYIGWFGEGVLIQAVLYNSLEVVDRLLQIPCVLKNAAAENNYALRLAVKNGRTKIANRLLEIDSVRNLKFFTELVPASTLTIRFNRSGEGTNDGNTQLDDQQANATRPRT